MARRGALALTVMCAALLGAGARSAHAYVYWANFGQGMDDRARRP